MPGLLNSRRSARLTALSSLLLFGTSATAQLEPVIEIRTAGLTTIEPTSKDAAAHAAFMLLGDRLSDLSTELEFDPMQEQGIGVLWDLLTSGVAIRIDLGEEGPGLAIAISPEGAGGAARLAESLGKLITDAGMPLEIDDNGGMSLGTPIGPATLSLANGAGEQFTLISLGATGEIVPGVSADGLPEGAQGIMSGRVDLERLGQFVLPLMARENEMMSQQLANSGWLGEGAPSAEFAVGVTDELMLSHIRVRNAKQTAMAQGMMTASFSLNELAAIPYDATLVTGSTKSFAGLIGLIEQAAAEAGEDPFGMASETLGVNVRDDVLMNLGPRMLYYQSDSTGGGGMLSSVLITELGDAASFGAAHDRIVSHLNELAAEEARGYVRIRSWKIGQTEVVSLSFPGVPIPLELSWCVYENKLVVAASPTGLIAAVGQLDGGGKSVLENPAFAGSVGAQWPTGGATMVTFMDSARIARKGYGLTNLLTSAMANAVRSPTEPERVAGPLMPGFAEFAEGISPSMQLGWWDGEDLVINSSADRSMLVQIATGAGMLTEAQGLAAPALLAGVFLPAMGKARESAKQIKSMTQVRGVVQTIMLYGQSNSEALPESAEVMIEDGYLPEEHFDSPYGPAWDDGASITFRVKISPELAFSYDMSVILAIDRSMLFVGDGTVNVGFADGSVRNLWLYELDEMLELEVNEGAREELQIP